MVEGVFCMRSSSSTQKTLLNILTRNFMYVHLLVNVRTYVKDKSSSNHGELPGLPGLGRVGSSGNLTRRRQIGAKGTSGLSRKDVYLYSNNSNYPTGFYGGVL